MAEGASVPRDQVREMEEARERFRQLLADAPLDDLRRSSDGTRWTNEQLLFHMLFGYLSCGRCCGLFEGLDGHPIASAGYTREPSTRPTGPFFTDPQTPPAQDPSRYVQPVVCARSPP